MRGDNRLINIRYRDGNYRRLPRIEADQIVEAGKAQYASNTDYRTSKSPAKSEKQPQNSALKEENVPFKNKRKRRGS